MGLQLVPGGTVAGIGAAWHPTTQGFFFLVACMGTVLTARTHQNVVGPYELHRHQRDTGRQALLLGVVQEGGGLGAQVVHSAARQNGKGRQGKQAFRG